MNDLKKIINDLISRKIEGPYWDFKREWYKAEKKGNIDLMHDIICMANNLEDHDAYIIIGVENETCDIIGVQEDTNRKHTKDLCDLLSSKKFFGGVRPSVRVETIDIDNSELDIIVIENSNKTPFYLTEDLYIRNGKEKYGISSYYIYTRIGDTNTERTSVADYDKVEYLWRKRFGLDKTPLQKLPLLLEDFDSWIKSPINNDEYDVLFYSQFPEYTIKSKKNDNSEPELYSFDFLDEKTYWFNIEIYYHQTLLRTFTGVRLDGYRYFIVAPTRQCLDLHSEQNKEEVPLFYYVENSLEFLLSIVLCKKYGNNIFSKSSNFKIDNLSKSVFLFKNNQELEKFINYVTSHSDQYFEIRCKNDQKKCFSFEKNKCNYENFEIFNQQKKQVLSLKELYDDFIDFN